MDKVWTIVSSDSGKPYNIIHNGRKWTCTCPHWQYRLRNTSAKCKHIEQALVLIQVQEYFDNIPTDVWLFDMSPFEGTPKPDALEIAQ